MLSHPINQLSHPLHEVRSRALSTIHSKIHHQLVDINEIIDDSFILSLMNLFNFLELPDPTEYFSILSKIVSNPSGVIRFRDLGGIDFFQDMTLDTDLPSVYSTQAKKLCRIATNKLFSLLKPTRRLPPLPQRRVSPQQEKIEEEVEKDLEISQSFVPKESNVVNIYLEILDIFKNSFSTMMIPTEGFSEMDSIKDLFTYINIIFDTHDDVSISHLIELFHS
ncbi:hypothetical protein GEMRC1_001302 [Eukaryota sp. GEM-RC1]